MSLLVRCRGHSAAPDGAVGIGDINAGEAVQGIAAGDEEVGLGGLGLGDPGLARSAAITTRRRRAMSC